MATKKDNQPPKTYARVSIELERDGVFSLTLSGEHGSSAFEFSHIHSRAAAKTQLLDFFNQLGKPAKSRPR